MTANQSDAVRAAVDAALPTPDQRPTVDLWPTAGQALGLGRAATYAAAARGEIPTLNIGRLKRVPTAALRRMLELDDEPEAS